MNAKKLSWDSGNDKLLIKLKTFLEVSSTPIKRNEIKAPVTQRPLGWGAWFGQVFKKSKQKSQFY